MRPVAPPNRSQHADNHAIEYQNPVPDALQQHVPRRLSAPSLAEAPNMRLRQLRKILFPAHRTISAN